MNLRTILVLSMVMLFVTGAWAQATVTKEVKKQAKTMKKEGWTVAEGGKSIELQLADLQQYMRDEDFIVESGSQVSKNYHLGYTSALAKAQRAIVSRLNTLIRSDINIIQKNVQSSDEEAESQTALNAQVRSLSAETLTNAFPVLVLSRELPDGTCEVQVHLAIAKPEK